MDKKSRSSYLLPWSRAMRLARMTEQELEDHLLAAGKKPKTIAEYRDGRKDLPIQDIGHVLVTYMEAERPPEVDELLDEITEWVGHDDRWDTLRHLVEIAKIMAKHRPAEGLAHPGQRTAGAQG